MRDCGHVRGNNEQPFQAATIGACLPGVALLADSSLHARLLTCEPFGLKKPTEVRGRRGGVGDGDAGVGRQRDGVRRGRASGRHRVCPVSRSAARSIAHTDDGGAMPRPWESRREAAARHRAE